MSSIPRFRAYKAKDYKYKLKRDFVITIVIIVISLLVSATLIYLNKLRQTSYEKRGKQVVYTVVENKCTSKVTDLATGYFNISSELKVNSNESFDLENVDSLSGLLLEAASQSLGELNSIINSNKSIGRIELSNNLSLSFVSKTDKLRTIVIECKSVREDIVKRYFNLNKAIKK